MCQQQHLLHNKCAPCSVWCHCVLFHCGNILNTKALKPHVHNNHGCKHHFSTHNTAQWLYSALECIQPTSYLFYLMCDKNVSELWKHRHLLCVPLSHMILLRQKVHPCRIWPDSSNGIIWDNGTKWKWWCSQSTDTFSSHIKQVAQWATAAHLGASIMFGKTIVYDPQWQVTLTWNSDKIQTTSRFYGCPCNL